MLFITFISSILSSKVLVRQGSNMELRLGVVYPDGKPKVRLVSSNEVPNGSYIDLFDITDCRTRLKTKEGFLCGNLRNDKVVLCSHQFYKTKFSFKNDGTGKYRLVTDKGKCITRSDYDKKSNGYKLKLKDCNKGDKQLFYVEKATVIENCQN